MVLGDGRVVKAIGVGSINLRQVVNGVETNGTLQDVLHVPELLCNLLSVSKMAANGLSVNFCGDECVIKTTDGKVLGNAKQRQGVYRLSGVPRSTIEVASVARTHNESTKLWHERLVHIGEAALRKLISSGLCRAWATSILSG